MSTSTSIVCVSFKCINTDYRRQFITINHSSTFGQLCEKLHVDFDIKSDFCVSNVQCGSGGDSEEKCLWTDMPDLSVTTGFILGGFGVKYMKILCKQKIEAVQEDLDQHAEATIVRPHVNAFTMLINRSKERGLPTLKTSSSGVQSGISRKDELFNDLVKDIQKRGATFRKDAADTDGRYITQVLCNALWYITNQHSTINDVSSKTSEVPKIPPAFQEYQGYNDVKRKKLKALPISGQELFSHTQVLYNICTKPVLKTTPELMKLQLDIKDLADSLNGYVQFLKKHATQQDALRSLATPAREVSEDCIVEHRSAAFAASVNKKYELLDSAVVSAGLLKPLFLDEKIHLKERFENRMQRHRFIEDLHLSVPVDLYKYSPGGSNTTVCCIVQVPTVRTDQEKLTQCARTMALIKPSLPEFHTRYMKAEFKEHVRNIVKVSPAVLQLLYKELTLDASASTNMVLQQRLRLIFMGETGLVADLRQNNTGRPTGKFDCFFEKMTEVVEKVTAADERRHNISHFSEWLSLRDLVQQTANLCPAGADIPSLALVRLQFAPRNPFIHSALVFTQKFQVQHKIQRRQLRIAHLDDHYCAAQFLYLKNLSVTLSETCTFFCCDDKSKIKFGEPGSVVSTGVRGRTSLIPTGTTLSAADHDVHTKGSITPSGYLDCDIPSEASKSFCRGTVTVLNNDSVLQSSNPFRHAAVLVKLMREKDEVPPILLKFSDGGVDQRNNLDSVKCSMICIFKELNLDMIVIGRTAPGQSWLNPAERIMSVLNIALQNCALERKPCVPEAESKLKMCNSMVHIRKAAQKHPELSKAWGESIKPVQDLIRSRMERLALKEKPVRTRDPISEVEIEELLNHLRTMFPTLKLDKLQKLHTRKNADFVKWMEAHCRERTYTFQIRKCEDRSCCSPPRVAVEKLKWLPDPVPDDTKEHYRPFSEVYGTHTTEAHRPSSSRVSAVQAREQGTEHRQLIQLYNDQHIQGEASMYTTQNAHSVVECTECQKPRCIYYNKSKITERHKTELAILLSEFEYSCGSPITPPHHSLHGKVYTRLNIQCEDHIEVQYYSSTATGRKDLCCFCVAEDTTVDVELKKQYKTVLPACAQCVLRGKKVVCMRPYGMAAKKYV